MARGYRRWSRQRERETIGFTLARGHSDDELPRSDSKRKIPNNAMAIKMLVRLSLSSFFKVLLDVGFYRTCLVGALLMFTMFVAIRAGTSKVSMSLPVRFEVNPSAYRIKGTGTEADVRIEDASGNVRVTRPPL